MSTLVKRELTESKRYRERLLLAVLWTVAAGFTFAFWWLIFRETAKPLVAAVLTASLLSVWTATLVRSLSFWIRLGVLLACLYATAFVTIVTRGYAPNVFMIFGFMVVLVTLLSGRRAGLITSAVSALTMLSVSWLQHLGAVVRDPNWQVYADSATAPVIIRVSTIFVFVMLSFVVAISYVVEHSEELAREKAQALAEVVARDTSLEALNQTLEQRVLERTAQLVEANASLSKEMQARRLVELELHQAQKLESVGRLAAGLAHEINTPVQFVSDSLHFLKDANNDLLTVLGKLREVQRSVLDGTPALPAAGEVANAEEETDLPYLLEHMPKAFERSLDGLNRVATIVRSMKEFAHPDQKEMTSVDLNHAIDSTLTVARGEYKLVAEVETKLGDIPQVSCYAGEINQALLNIIVNAAHAIEDVVRGTDKKGLIRVETAQDGDAVVISIRDTGGGIPLAIRDQIFEPFFTTKEVGRGTGQGLAIARSVIVGKHGGRLTFETKLGEGTTFIIWLPLDGKR